MNMSSSLSLEKKIDGFKIGERTQYDIIHN